MCTYDEHLEAELLPLGSTVQINKNSSLEKEQNAWNRGKRRRSCVLTYRCSKKKKRVRINGGNVSAREPTTKCTQKKKRRKDGNGRSRVKVWDSIFFFFYGIDENAFLSSWFSPQQPTCAESHVYQGGLGTAADRLYFLLSSRKELWRAFNCKTSANAK